MLRQIFGNIPLVVRNLLIINILVFIAQVTFNDNTNYTGPVEKIFALHSFENEFNPYQLITYSYLHAPNQLGHLIFNMIPLFFFGRVLESHWGSKRFLIYYTITGILAGLTQLLIGDFGITLGASGSTFGLLAAFGLLFPNSKIFLLIPPIPIKAKYFVSIYLLIELSAGVYVIQGDNIAHFAHLGGAISGLILLFYWKRKGDIWF